MSDNPATTTSPGGSVDFGFRQVPVSEKAGMVRAVFDSVASRYDLMNDLMSLGIHRVWKQIFVSDLDPRPRHELLDLAGGTGDISFGWLGRGGGPVILSDINAAMLSVGRDRAMDRGFAGSVSLLVADAEKLPLPDRVVDRVSIAFGLRNCTNKDAVLAEARRVLKPGGRFLCLEFSRVQVAALAPMARRTRARAGHQTTRSSMPRSSMIRVRPLRDPPSRRSEVATRGRARPSRG